MSAKTLYKSNVTPKCFHRFPPLVLTWFGKEQKSSSVGVGRPFRTIEVWTTTCIVSNFGKTRPNDTNCSVLINPCNPSLSGVKNFPYFPRGGPVPKEKPTSMHKDWQPLGFVSSWGGMEVGNGMMYSSSVVDGIVHQYGGWKLQAECTVHRLTAAAMGRNDPCPIGSAIRTSSGSDTLLKQYDSIIHTTPPFYKYDPNPEHNLSQCYKNSFRLAFGENSNNNRPVRVAVPLIGSGARGFPYDEAIEIASSAAVRWVSYDKDDDDNVGGGANNNHEQNNVQKQHNPHTIVFGLLEDYLAEQLCSAIQNKYPCNDPNS